MTGTGGNDLGGTGGDGDIVDHREPWDVMVKRGLRRRCPRCGAGGLFHSWVRMREHCPSCGFKFEREPGFFLGAMFVNFAVTEGLLFVVVMVFVGIKANNPDASIVGPLAVGGAASVVAPIVLYPFARTTWSAIDLAMTPLELEEIVDATDRVHAQREEPPQPRRDQTRRRRP